MQISKIWPEFVDNTKHELARTPKEALQRPARARFEENFEPATARQKRRQRDDDYDIRGIGPPYHRRGFARLQASQLRYDCIQMLLGRSRLVLAPVSSPTQSTQLETSVASMNQVRRHDRVVNTATH
ncbi:hypothetical protein [Bradyrhizobium cosmicum]|uniref:hypothetical protein n=1 Tax=Bradyrhizobium cosmicum TaxID=1404864 RepID=UPI0028F03B55|nr:hypothetical protein [Bradyrhizobium cosmicum]